jgi:glycine cleavage system H protein
MPDQYAILPCNGLDKCAGCISREIALTLAAETDGAVICPVFFSRAAAKYVREAQDKTVIVIDGCASRCAGKLAADHGLKADIKINVTEEAKAAGITLPKGLVLDDDARALAKRVVSDITSLETAAASAGGSSLTLPDPIRYTTYTKDKFIFRVPQNPGFYFNENDVWAYVDGDKARIGVTDFAQKSLSDIIFFTPEALDAEVEQFDTAGEIESGKAVFEIVSPVSGRITAINSALLDAPERINENPYEQGWIAEIALSDFEGDQDLLLDSDGYFEVLKRKVDEFHV